MKRSCHILPLLIAIGVAIAITSCSNKKNTAQSRWWQAFTARYNTYYNGSEAFKDGYMAQRDGNKDNYMEILPYFIVSNKETAEVGKSLYDRTILKCEKTIKLHSIKAKPKVAPDKKKTEKILQLSIAPAFAEAIKRVHSEKPISAMFE